MFDIGWSELLVIAVVAIDVVGPKDLPPLMRTFGKYAGKLRRAASDFQRQFEDLKLRFAEGHVHSPDVVRAIGPEAVWRGLIRVNRRIDG